MTKTLYFVTELDFFTLKISCYKLIKDLLQFDCCCDWHYVNKLMCNYRYLPLQTLNQMADCHSGRNCVRVDDDVRSDPLTGEWHVLQNKANQ